LKNFWERKRHDEVRSDGWMLHGSVETSAGVSRGLATSRVREAKTSVPGGQLVGQPFGSERRLIRTAEES
jgi:hypothetical protein